MSFDVQASRCESVGSELLCAHFHKQICIMSNPTVLSTTMGIVYFTGDSHETQLL